MDPFHRPKPNPTQPMDNSALSLLRWHHAECTTGEGSASIASSSWMPHFM